MATRKTKTKPKAKAKPPAKKAPAKKPAKKSPAKAKRRAAAADTDEVRLLQEELAAARAELQRLGSGENSARRDLDDRSSRDAAVEERLRAELEAVRLDLRTALADLEIARAAESRTSNRLGALEGELDAAQVRAERLQAELGRLRDETPTSPPPDPAAKPDSDDQC